MPCYWDTLAGLKIPVTVMVGASDQKFLRFAAPMVERLPMGRHVIVPDAGHNVVLSQPRAVAQALYEDL
jgi:2-succinyl-6-hydroxy-2,4-cyclohexadiene-1-carboxylate synthase